MSRASIVLILVLLLIIGGIFLLSSIDTEVQPTQVEKVMLNDVAPR